MSDDLPFSEQSLRQKTVNGVGWISLSQIGRQGFQFLTSVILARLLLPSDMGLIGMILVFTGFATILGDLGFGSALIQREEVEARHLTAVFWLNIISGFTLTLLIILLAPLISQFYGEPRLTALTRLLAINFSITALAVTQKSILSRQMRFRSLALAEIVSVIFAGIIAISMAFSGFGVWSLIWQLLLVSLFSTIILWRYARWYPEFSFDKTAVKELIGYSSNLLGFNVFNYWSRNADNLLIGRYIGATGLGIYSTAYSFMLLPLSQITRMISRVMFPALSRVQNDKERVKRIYLRAIAIIALITFPLMTGLLVVAEDFVLAVYGAKWIGLIRPLQILSLVGMYQSVGATVGWIYQSQGRTDLMFRWGIFAGLAGITSFAVGVRIGNVEAVAASYAILNVLLLYWLISIPGKLINMNVGEVFHSLKSVILSTIIMAVAVLIVSSTFPQTWNSWTRLILSSCVGIVFYLFSIYIGKVKAFYDVLDLLTEQVDTLKQFRLRFINR